MTLKERIEKVLERVLFAHHDDISKQDDDNIAQAASDILKAVELDEKKIWKQ